MQSYHEEVVQRKVAWSSDVVGMGLDPIRESSRRVVMTSCFTTSCNYRRESETKALLFTLMYSSNSFRLFSWTKTRLPWDGLGTLYFQTNPQNLVNCWIHGRYSSSIHGGLWDNLHIRVSRTLQVGGMTKHDSHRFCPSKKGASTIYIYLYLYLDMDHLRTI